jgi:hypothetical protein
VPPREDFAAEEAESDTNEDAIPSASVLRMAREAVEEEEEDDGIQYGDEDSEENGVYGKHSGSNGADGKHHYGRI